MTFPKKDVSVNCQSIVDRPLFGNSMDELPVEILNKCLRHLNDVKLAQICHQNKHINSHLWAARTIRIKCRKQLLDILNHTCTRFATKMDFSHSDIDDVDLGFVAKHFQRITHIDLSYCHELTDDGLESLLIAQGANLTHLKLKKLFKLSNFTMECMQKIGCPKLKCLDIEGTMISASGLGMLATANVPLARLNLSKCHLIDPNLLNTILSQLKHLKSVSLRNLDFLLPFHIESLLLALPLIRMMDVSNCEEITVSFVKAMQQKHPKLELLNNAKLEDHSANSVRQYLLGLIAS